MYLYDLYGEVLPTQILLISPPDQHLARDFLKNCFVFRRKKPLPIASMSFW